MRTYLANRLTLRRGIRFLKRAGPLAVADAAVLASAYFIVHSVRIGAIPPFPEPESRLFLFGVVVVTLASLFIFGGYQRLWASTSGHDVKVIIAASFVSALITGIADLVMQPRPFPLSVALTAQFVAMTGFVAVRYQTRLISGLAWRWDAIWHQRFPASPTRVLIIGAGEAGQVTAMRLKHRAPKSQHYHIVGFVDDDPAKQNLYIEGCRVLGVRADIACLTSKHYVDLIIVALHNISGPDFREVLEYCEHTSARIKIVPDVFALFESKKGTSSLRDVQAEDLLGRQCVMWHEDVDVTPIAHKTLLVTGAAGSIGSELCRQLLNHAPTQLILLDNNESSLHDLVDELSSKFPTANLQPFLADITNPHTLHRLFTTYKPQVIFHSAAYKHVPMLQYFPDEAIRVNIEGTRNVASLAQKHGVERFVLISTDKAVNPTGVMGASKRICELMMHAFSQQGGHSTRFTSVRFGNVLGSRGSVVPTFNRQIDAGGPITVTARGMARYFMTIPEAVNLVIHAACLTEGDDLFMLRMGEEVYIVDLAERMIRLRGLVPHKDITIEYVGIRPGEKLCEELHSEHEKTIPTLHPHIVELVSGKNGFQPLSFFDRINLLVKQGLDPNRDAVEQLHEIIALGEVHHSHEEIRLVDLAQERN